MSRRRNVNNSGYAFASLISFVLRFALCYITIETVPIFESELIAIIFGQIVSIYVVLKIIAYGIVGALGYERGEEPVLGVVLYGIVHTVLVLITWGILAILAAIGVLPI